MEKVNHEKGTRLSNNIGYTVSRDNRNNPVMEYWYHRKGKTTTNQDH